MEIGHKHHKSIEEYRHNIKLLKYYLKKQQRINETLKYKSIKNEQKQKKKQQTNAKPKEKIYSMLQTVSKLNSRLKFMGISLNDLFRMADTNYQGQINKGQFMKVVGQLKADIEENSVQELFYSIDTNLNGILDQDQYLEFLCAYGGADHKDAHKFQKKTLEKFAAQLKKKSIKAESFLADSMDPISAPDFKKKLSGFTLNENQIMILLKAFDPTNVGQINHQLFIEQMKTVKEKNEQAITNQEMEKDIKYMCVQWRQKKINPIKIFEEADADKKDGITPAELQEAFASLMPNETKFNIKKWVKIINLNNDRQISRQEFINSIRSFYALNQLEKFSADYDKQNPNARRSLNNEQISTETIIKKLQQKIEDSKMTKTEAFRSMDINGDGTLTKEELTEGLKKFGFKIVFIGRVLTVFDRNCSEGIQLDEWLKILGEDIEIEDVAMPEEDQDQKPIKNKKEQKPKKDNKNEKEIKKTAKPESSNKQKNTKNEKKLKEQTEKAESLHKQINTKNLKVAKEEKDPKNSKKVEDPKKTPKDSDVLKDSKNVKDIKSTKIIDNPKKDPKKSEKQTKSKQNPIKPVKYVQDQEQYGQQYQPQQVQTEVDKIEQEVGIKYKKRPEEVLSIFRKFNLRNKPFINQKSLKTILQELRVTFVDDQIQLIFEDNIEAGVGNMNYQAWLERIAETYAADVQKEQKPEVKKTMKLAQTSDLKMKRTDSKIMDEKKKIDPSKQSTKQKSAKLNLNKSDAQKITNKKPLPFQKLVQKPAKRNQQQNNSNGKLIYSIEVSEDLQILRREYLEKAKKMKASKQKFVDKQFPANVKSLSFKPDESKIDNAYQKVKFLKWKHYSEIYKNPSLFQGSIEPNDIIQGSLGNCYFLSALSCLAEYPSLIERLFEYYDLETGYFLIWLCIDGKWNLYEVDGYIVVNAAGTAPYFSYNQKEQLWVILLEKAYAKAYGCYENVIGGDPAAAIRDLSGSPSESLFHERLQIDQLWEKLFDANKNKFIMAAATDHLRVPQKKIQGHQQGITEEGLVLGHAYSILDLHVEGRDKIIQLRNPWGKMQWKRDWSDQSSKWTQSLRKKLNFHSNAEDGIFWMPFSQYFARYRSTCINFLRSTNFYQSSNQPGAQSLLIKASGSDLKELWITVSQQDHRHLQKPNENQYTRVNLMPAIFKKGEQTVTIVRRMDEKTMFYSKDVQIKIQQIEQDEEVVVIVKLNQQTNVTVSSYANCQIDFSVQELGEEDELMYLQAIAFQFAEDEKYQNSGLYYWVSRIGNKAFLCFQNKQSPNSKAIINILQLKNLNIISPQKEGKNILKIPRGQIKSIRAQLIDPNQGYHFKNFSIQFSQ